MRPKLVIFEGPDRVGKSSTIEEFRSRRPQIDVIYDRGAISNMVYNEFYGRGVEDSTYVEFLPDSSNFVIVFLNAKTETLIDRAMKTEGKSLSQEEYDSQKKVFRAKLDYIKRIRPKIKILEIYTDNISQKETVDEIEDAL